MKPKDFNQSSDRTNTVRWRKAEPLLRRGDQPAQFPSVLPGINSFGFKPCQPVIQKIKVKKGCAYWLISNTAWTFEQIAFYCNLHTYEIKQIADLESFHYEVDLLKTKIITPEIIKHYESNPAEIPEICEAINDH